jgi:hypothetical protein
VSAFEYVSVFISIVLGLAVVHLLGGVSLILDQRVKARLDWIHGMWVLNMLALIIWVWYGNWELEQVEAFSPLHFLSMVIFSIVLYLMCGLLFPVRGAEVEDFREQFEMNRSRFFHLGQGVVLASALKVNVDYNVLGESDVIERAIMQVGLVIAFGIAARTTSRRYQGALAVAFFLLVTRWVLTE